ncbi:MAG: beta-galactosidase, partial [Clostridia bacterium]|nr:beta-galactosidase [Clostridia bacterium]
PGLCFDHDEVRALEARFITNVLKETKKHSNVAFYEPMNEPHQWLDPTKKTPSFFCYCPATIEKFRRWLEKKYGTIEGLNQAWGYTYDSFSQVRPPRWMASYSDYIDFRLFMMDNIAEEVRFRADIIRANDNKPVIAHAWGGGSVTCPHLGEMAFDDWKNAQVVDKWGYSAFPRADKDCYALGLSCDATRNAADGKDFWQSELSAGIVGGVFRNHGRISGDTFDKFTLESIRHGAKGLLYWQFRKERIGTEAGGYAMTDYDGGPTPLTEKAGQLGAFLKENGTLLEHGTAAPAEVALVFSVRSYLADWISVEKASNHYAVNCMSGYYRMFWEENIAVDIIHEHFAKDLDRYKLIILPTATAIDPALAQKLRRYVENGGTVLSEHSFGLFDETLKLSYQVPGYGFTEIFGAKEDDICNSKEQTITNGEQCYRIQGTRYAQSLRLRGGSALYTYEDGTPAIVSHRYGKGQAILTGVNLGHSYSEGSLLGDDVSAEEKQASQAPKEIVFELCKEVGLRPNCCSAKDVKVTILQHQSTLLIILINSAADNRTGSIALPTACSHSQTVYGSCDHSLNAQTLIFSIEGNKSA